MELCEFIKDKKNIYQHSRALIRGIRIAYVRAQEEKGTGKPGKTTQATQVTLLPQRLLGENAGKRSHEGMSEISGP